MTGGAMRLLELIKRILRVVKGKYHPNTAETPENGETREVRSTETREVKRAEIASSLTLVSRARNDKLIFKIGSNIVT